MFRITLVAALVATATAFNTPASALPRSRMAVSRVAPAAVRMDETTKAEVVGAAAVGGIFGVYFFHELSAGLLWASILAYAATTSSSFGSFSKSAGSTAAKAWDKIDEQLKLSAAVDKAVSKAEDLKSSITGKVSEL